MYILYFIYKLYFFRTHSEYSIQNINFDNLMFLINENLIHMFLNRFTHIFYTE